MTGAIIRTSGLLGAAAVLVFLVSLEAVAASAVQDWLAEHHDTDLYGFIEARGGFRLDNDADEKEAAIAEARLQLELGRDFNGVLIKVKGDLVGDLVEEEVRAELREANFLFSPLAIVDIKAGRQVLTWGTGDLLFINDLFPKDWESFFIGRDDEYLKAPSDAVKASLFFDLLNLDLVYVPVMNPSRYIDGSRLSYWNSLHGRTAGRDFIFPDHKRNRLGNDAEYGVRMARNLAGVEFALYAYSGFWKTPEGVDPDPAGPRLLYPALTAYGASMRTPVWGGIGNLEAGYYDSRDDRDGTDPLVRNSEVRFLAGFERELAREITGGLQYYLEYKQDYDAYEASLPVGMHRADEFRHLLTLRLTRLLMNQNLMLSLFLYYSPSDKDAYLRPKVLYKLSDVWTADAGGNIFLGSDDHTFFGQFQDNTNLYLGLRANF